MLASQKTKITELFKNALAAVGAPENTKIVLERPKQQSHGDIALYSGAPMCKSHEAASEGHSGKTGRTASKGNR